MAIVLVEPEIPPNTGNIARTCAATGTGLHLIKPLGFSLDDKHLKRAGLDYWAHVKLEVHESFQDFLDNYQARPIYFATTKATRSYCEIQYEADAIFVFGKETRGLPKAMIDENVERTIRIPMGDGAKLRSLNLGNSAAIVIYEALRQLSFPGLL